MELYLQPPYIFMSWWLVIITITILNRPMPLLKKTLKWRGVNKCTGYWHSQELWGLCRAVVFITLIFTYKFLCGWIKDDKMDGACSTHGRYGNCHWYKLSHIVTLWEASEERLHTHTHNSVIVCLFVKMHDTPHPRVSPGCLVILSTLGLLRPLMNVTKILPSLQGSSQISFSV